MRFSLKPFTPTLLTHESSSQPQAQPHTLSRINFHGHNDLNKILQELQRTIDQQSRNGQILESFVSINAFTGQIMVTLMKVQKNPQILAPANLTVMNAAIQEYEQQLQQQTQLWNKGLRDIHNREAYDRYSNMTMENSNTSMLKNNLTALTFSQQMIHEQECGDNRNSISTDNIEDPDNINSENPSVLHESLARSRERSCSSPHRAPSFTE